jgi:hypothetical protein
LGDHVQGRSNSALYPRSNRPVQDRLSCILTRWRGQCFPPMSRSFDSNLESFSAIRGLFICHFSCQLFPPQIGLSFPDHHILSLSSFGLMRPNQNLGLLQLHSIDGKRLLIHLHLMKHQTTFVDGRLNLSTKHIAIISGMRIRIMKHTICTSFNFIKWRHSMRNFNFSKRK